VFKTKNLYTLALLIGSILLYAFSFPKFGIFPAGFFFLIPLLIILERHKKPKSFLLFFVFSFFSYLLILYWIPRVMVQYGGMARVLSVFGLLLLAAFLSLFTGLAGMLIKSCLKSGHSHSLLALIPLIWVAKDLVIEKVLGGFPWCLAGYSQYANRLFIQIAEWGGIHLVTFVLIYLNVLLYLLMRQRTKNLLAAVLVSFVAVYSVGFYLQQANGADVGGQKVHRAGIIQPNVDPEQYLNGPQKLNRLEGLLNESRLLRDRGAEFIVWPEFTLSIYPRQNSFYKQKLNAFAADQAPLFAGFTDLHSHREIYNSVMLFKGDSLEKYDKVHLTPFGEYVLFREILFFVRRIVDEIADFTPGRRVRNLTIAGHPVATPICYEIIFPELVRDFIAGGGQLVVNVSNDAWFGDTSAPYQHLAMAVFRSVENRRYILRSTTNGISALISPSGKVLYQSPYGSKDRFIASFRYLQTKTLFTRVGFLFPYFCALLVIIYFGINLLGNRPKKAVSSVSMA
jgi:apolipoprotein N-acyltransferase